jgi:hypothetical protein
MKFTKLIMLASVVSLACACEKEMPAETVPAPDQAKETRVSTHRRNGAANQRTGSYG